MATTVTYNKIQLENVITRRFEQQLKYDESKTDLMYHEFRIEVEGICHIQGLPAAPAWIGGEYGQNTRDTAAAQFDGIQRQLSQPRQNFEMYIGSDLLLRAVPSNIAANMQDPDRDVDNGPKPEGVSITHIAGNQVLRVSFGITIAKVLCVTPVKTYGVLNNRWSVGETMDDHFRVTRNIRGRIRLAQSTIPAHFYKTICIPALETGFRRANIEYTVDPDGLTCDYQVTDIQVHTAAPWPATHISGTHTESTNDGVNFYADCAIRLEGPPNADKRAMITQGIRVVEAKIGIITNPGMGDRYMLTQGAIIDHIGDVPAIEVRYQIRHQFDKTRELLANLRQDRIGKPLVLEALEGIEYKNTVSQTPAPYGYNSHGGTEPRDPAIALFLMHCYLQSPCNDYHAIAGQSLQEGSDKEEPGYIPPTEVSGYIPDPPVSPGDYYNKEAQASMYMAAEVESRYYFEYCRAHMPVASETFDTNGGGESSESKTEVSTVVCNLSQPQCRREIRITAERVGRYPAMPRPVEEYTDGELKGYLLRYWDRAVAPRLAADGRKLLYTIQAYYLYALNRPPKGDEATRVGILPFTSIEVAKASLTRDTIWDEQADVSIGENVET